MPSTRKSRFRRSRRSTLDRRADREVVVVGVAVVDERAVAPSVASTSSDPSFQSIEKIRLVGGSTAVALNDVAEHLRVSRPHAADRLDAGRLRPPPRRRLTGIGEKLFWAVIA